MSGGQWVPAPVDASVDIDSGPGRSLASANAASVSLQRTLLGELLPGVDLQRLAGGSVGYSGGTIGQVEDGGAGSAGVVEDRSDPFTSMLLLQEAADDAGAIVRATHPMGGHDLGAPVTATILSLIRTFSYMEAGYSIDITTRRIADARLRRLIHGLEQVLDVDVACDICWSCGPVMRHRGMNAPADRVLVLVRGHQVLLCSSSATGFEVGDYFVVPARFSAYAQSHDEPTVHVELRVPRLAVVGRRRLANAAARRVALPEVRPHEGGIVAWRSSAPGGFWLAASADRTRLLAGGLQLDAGDDDVALARLTAEGEWCSVPDAAVALGLDPAVVVTFAERAASVGLVERSFTPR